MVQRKLLDKMSDKELENYIKPNSSYVYAAVKIAFEILKNRGRQFSEDELYRINQLISAKQVEDESLKSLNEWDVDEDNNEQSIKLYSQKSVWYFSIFFGIHLGAILLAINFFKISKSRIGLAVLIFGTFYALAMFLVYRIGEIYIPDYYQLILILMLAGGGSILQFFFWDKYLKGTAYRKKEITNPLIICLLFYAFLFVVFFI